MSAVVRLSGQRADPTRTVIGIAIPKDAVPHLQAVHRRIGLRQLDLADDAAILLADLLDLPIIAGHRLEIIAIDHQAVGTQHRRGNGAHRFAAGTR